MRSTIAKIVFILFLSGVAWPQETPELIIQKGHTSKILGLSSIEGTAFLASVSFDGTINIWDTQSGSVLQTIYNKGSDGDIEPFVSGTFAPDGSWVAGLTKEGQVRRFSLPQGAQLNEFSPPAQYAPWGTNQPESPLLATDGTSLYYVPGARVDKETIYKLDLDGKLLGKLETNGARGLWRLAPGKIAVMGKDRLFFYSTDTLQLMNETPVESPYFHIAFNSTGTKLALHSSDGLKVIDANSMALLHVLPYADGGVPRTRYKPVWAGEKLYALAYSSVAPDQKVFQANFDASITEPTAAEGVGEFGASLEDGRLALGGFDFSPRIVDPESGGSTELAAETGGFSTFAITSTGDLITGGRKGDVRYWSGKTGQLVKTFRGLNETRVTAIAVSPDGKHLVAGDDRGTAICWDTESGEPVAKMRGSASAQYEGGASLLAFQGNDRFFRGVANSLTLYSLSGEAQRSWDMGGSTMAIDSARQRIAAGSSKVGEISLTNKREALLVQSFGYEATALLYDSTELLVGTSGGALYRWDYSEPESKPELLAQLEKDLVVWSILADGSSWTLLTSGGEYGELVEVSKAGEIGRRVRYPGADLKYLTLTPGGRLMARGHNYTLQFYDKDSGERLGALVGVNENEGWVALETDGHFDGNSDGVQTISIKLDGEVFKVDQFLQQYLAPGSLARLLGDAKEANLKRTAPTLTATTLKKPPKVSILEPVSGAVVQGDSVTLKIAASDQGGGIGKLALSHNGHRLPESQIRPAGEGRYEVVVTPVKGANDFSATAFDATNSVESRADRCRVMAPNVEQRPPRLHLLSIGIDTYSSGLALNLAAVDSESISKQFSSDLYAPGTRLHLTNEEATLEGIRKAVDQLSAQADPQDAFVFYLAGHGTVVGDIYYFLPHDVKIESDEALVASSISSEELAQALRQIPATKQLLILDSCKSGAAVGVVGRYYAARSGLEEIRSQQILAKSSGTFLIAATKADDYAYEIPELGHGVLTFAILEALGKTKSAEAVSTQVTVNDLLRSVSSRVPSLSQKYQGVNQQVLQYSSGQDFLIQSSSDSK